MSSASVCLSWSDLWPATKGMSASNQRALAEQLDDTEGGFPHWIRTRSPKVQVEVLGNAPESVVEYMYRQNVLAPEAVNKLNLPYHATAKIVDHRSRR